VSEDQHILGAAWGSLEAKHLPGQVSLGSGRLIFVCVQGLGYAISLAGFFLYNYIKMQKIPARSTTPLKHGEYTAVAQTDAETQKGNV
jgi:hypothetical protein